MAITRTSRRWQATLALLSLAHFCTLVGATGCEGVDGGAVEVSWKLRPASSSLDEKFVACDPGLPGTNAVTRIRLEWQVGDATGIESWSCGDSQGVTNFDLPPGSALLRVLPECADGPADPRAYIAPAPEQRRVTVGDTVNLGAVELVLLVSYCDRQPCICSTLAPGVAGVASELPSLPPP